MNAVLKVALGGMLARELTEQTIEINERRQVFKQAREYADYLEKPLLVVGAPKFSFNHPCGDTTIDISPDIPATCDYQVADVRDIPYPDGYFGAAFISHVLEHLYTVDDACSALDELERVADRVFVVSPHKSSIAAWLHPSHHLWITHSGDGYIIEQRGPTPANAKQGSYIASMVIL